MPEGKITRQGLKDHFRRLWAVYLAGVVLLCFLNGLVYDVTRPGFSDDETLKIMLLNADVSISEDALLEQVRSLGFRAVETVPLAVSAGDPTSEMLLMVQLTGGYGDIYVADEAGFKLLEAHGACHTARETEGGLQLVATVNGTNVETAVAALDALAKELGE